MRVVITRSREDSEILASQIARPCFHEPLLSFTPVLPPESWAGITQATDLIMTSAQVFKLYPQLSQYTDKTLWCVGDVTAAAGRALGFQRVKVASGRAASLLRLILEQGDPAGHYMYLSAREPHTDIVHALSEKGLHVDSWVAYETHYAESLSPELKDLLLTSEPLLIPFYSFNTMKKFVELVQKENLAFALDRAHFLVPRSEMVTYLNKFSWKKVQIWSNLNVEGIQQAYDAIMSSNLSMSQRLKWGLIASVAINLMLVGVGVWGYFTYVNGPLITQQDTISSTSQFPTDIDLKKALRADMQQHADALQARLVALEEKLAHSWQQGEGAAVPDKAATPLAPTEFPAHSPIDEGLLQVYREIMHQLYASEASAAWVTHQSPAWDVFARYHIHLTDAQKELLMQRSLSMSALTKALFSLWEASFSVPSESAKSSAPETSFFGRLPYIGDGLKIRIRPAPESKSQPTEGMPFQPSDLYGALWSQDTRAIERMMASIPDSGIKRQWYEDYKRFIERRELLQALESRVYAQLIAGGA